MNVLVNFYKNIRPWGWWHPVYLQLRKEDATARKNYNFYKDMGNCIVGIVWQSSQILIPIFLLVRDYPKMWWSLAVFAFTTIILKFTWLDVVRKYKD